jgi:hypothetical protein
MVGSTNGFNAPVTLSVSGLPSGTIAGFNPNPVVPPTNSGMPATLQISTSGSTPTGTSSLTVQGNSGSTTHKTAANLTVTGTVAHNPVCTAAKPNPAVLWSPNHKLIPVQILGVTDPDNLSTTIAVTAVTQDEPVNGLGAGDTSPDAVIKDQGVLLRAERAGKGNGRVYHVSFTATDSKGGNCSGTVNVSVPHDNENTAIDEGQLYNSLQP